MTSSSLHFISSASLHFTSSHSFIHSFIHSGIGVWCSLSYSLPYLIGGGWGGEGSHQVGRGVVVLVCKRGHLLCVSVAVFSVSCHQDMFMDPSWIWPASSSTFRFKDVGRTSLVRPDIGVTARSLLKCRPVSQVFLVVSRIVFVIRRKHCARGSIVDGRLDIQRILAASSDCIDSSPSKKVLVFLSSESILP